MIDLNAKTNVLTLRNDFFGNIAIHRSDNRIEMLQFYWYQSFGLVDFRKIKFCSSPSYTCYKSLVGPLIKMLSFVVNLDHDVNIFLSCY